MQAGDEVQAAPPQQAWRRDRLRRAFASALFFFVLLTMTDFDQKGRTPRSAARRVQTNASEVEAATARAERRVEAMQAMIGSCAKPMGRNISGRYFGSWRGSTAAPPPSGSAGWFDDERDGAPRGTPRVDGAVSWQALSSDCRTEAIAAVMRHELVPSASLGRHELLVEPSTALAHPTASCVSVLNHPEHKSHPLLGHDDAAEAQPPFAGSVMADEQAESL